MPANGMTQAEGLLDAERRVRFWIADAGAEGLMVIGGHRLTTVAHIIATDTLVVRTRTAVPVALMGKGQIEKVDGTRWIYRITKAGREACQGILRPDDCPYLDQIKPEEMK